MRAEHLAQRPVQDVRGRVVAADPVAAHLVDRGLHLVAHLERPRANGALVDDDRTGNAVSGVANVERGAAQRRDRAGVADLAARLRVERRAIERDLDRRTFDGLVYRPAADDERDDLRLADRLASPGELRGPELVEHLAPDCAVAGRGTGFVGCRARPLALLRHAPVEIVEIDTPIARARDLAREIDREAERVVQEERVGAAHVAPVEQLAEHLDTALQRGAERLLLALDDLRHRVVAGDDLGVRRAHDVDRDVDHRRQHEVARAEEVRMEDRAPDDAAEHVAALVVRRAHTVGDDERHRARARR